MSFNVGADAYTSFMGRFSVPLAEAFIEHAQVSAGERALDVGCGPGALTGPLVDRLGSHAVAAIDPSESFVEAVGTRFPQVDVRSGAAEHLPFADDDFDVALAQLVVHFMADPVAGLAEMGRVTRPGGRVAACVWDHAGGGGPLSLFWRAVHDIDPAAPGEATLAGTSRGHLAELCEQAGLADVDSTMLTVSLGFATFADWWDPFTLGVGPAGAYVTGLDDERREQVRARCAELLPEPPFELTSSAWSVVARAR